MKIQRKSLLLLLLLAGIMAGCGKSDKPQFTTGKNTYSIENTEETVEKDARQKVSGGLYVISEIDTQMEIITFQKVQNGKLVEHEYTGGTCFYNKYGDMMPVSSLEAGQVVMFEANKETDALTKVQISAEAWEKDDVENYKFDMDKNMLTMGGSNYQITDNTCFFSDDGEILASDIESGDRIRVNGIDKKVLAVTVTTGHGELTLTNTDTFNGGFIGLYGDKRYYYEISDYMTIEIPEGDYTVTFTNNGYGGSTDVTIERGETVSLNLESLKSEEPQSCLIAFTATVPDTKVFVDGKEVDITQPVEVIYGTHSLQASATGYTAWNKQLIVNSSSANIIIDLTNGKDEEEETEEEIEEGTEEIEEDTETDLDETDDNGTYNGGSGVYNSGSGTYAGKTAGSSAGSMAGSSAGSLAGSTSNNTSTNTNTHNTTTNTNNSSTTTTNSNSTTNNSNNSGNTTNETNNTNTTTTNTSSDNNSMSNRYNTTVDKNDTTNQATNAYLDTLSGIVDTLSGGKTN